MPAARLNSAAVLVLGTAWGLVLVVAGLGAMTGVVGPFGFPRPAVVLAGLTMIAMGEFVFFAVVCHRLFPDAGMVVAAGEVAFGLMFVGLGLAAAATAVLGASA